MIESILGVALVLVSLVAEAMRRKWKQSDERANENARKYAELLQTRNDAWTRGDLGGLFNSGEDQTKSR